jgi:hypothetical protein
MTILRKAQKTSIRALRFSVATAVLGEGLLPAFYGKCCAQREDRTSAQGARPQKEKAARVSPWRP